MDVRPGNLLRRPAMCTRLLESPPPSFVMVKAVKSEGPSVEFLLINSKGVSECDATFVVLEFLCN